MKIMVIVVHPNLDNSRANRVLMRQQAVCEWKRRYPGSLQGVSELDY